MSDEQRDAPGASSSPATSGSARRRSTRGRTTPWPSRPTAGSSPSTPGCSRATRPSSPDSKINALVENVAAIWRRTAATRGTQMIFCDMGVNPTPWGYSVYDEIIAKLVAAASPASRSPPSATPTPTPRSRPSSRRSGSGTVRVLIGSTQKMGTGTNVQKRLVRPASPRRPVEAGRGRAAGGPHPPAGQRERGGRDLPLRHRRVVRRLHVAGAGDQGPVHRPGDDGRERRSGRPRTSAARSSPTPR